MRLVWLWSAGLVMATAGAGLASPMSEVRKYAVERPLVGDLSPTIFEERAIYSVLEEQPASNLKWTMHAGMEPVNYHIATLLHDEDWSDWRDFTSLETKVIPLGSARRVLYMTNTGFLEKEPLSAALWKDPEKARQYIDILQRMYYLGEPRLWGYLRLEETPDRQRPYSHWSLVGFLTQDEGLFSGRPWSWENFLPRFFTVGGMLLGGLLGVEFLRFIINLGKQLGARRKGGPPGA